MTTSFAATLTVFWHSCFFVFLGAFLSPSSLLGADQSGVEVQEAHLKAIQDRFKNQPHLKVQFKQTIYRASRNRTQNQEGRASFSKPDMFLWVLQGDHPKQWIYDGKDLVEYNEKQKKAVRYKSGAGQGSQIRLIVDMVLDLDALLKKYLLKKAVIKNDLAEMTLRSRTPGDIDQIDLRLNLSQNYIQNIKITYSNKNYTQISFFNPSHQNISKSAYTFKAPSGVLVRDFKL